MTESRSTPDEGQPGPAGRTGAGLPTSSPHPDPQVSLAEPVPITEPAALRAPGMLLIGAASRDAGKTELACDVLRRVSKDRAVVAVKVTTVHTHRGPCPRGGAGCGVCSALDARFVITEERGKHPEKDTARLLRSGAQRVLWLRVRRPAIVEGAAELLARLCGPDTLCVCESNSLRLAVEPGLFVSVRRAGSPEIKASAAAVAQFTDLEVVSDGQAFAPPPGELQPLAGSAGWAWRRPATAIVLAGGRSRRMGTDKALLPIDGRPMIEHVVRQLEPHFAEVLVSAAEPDRYAFLGKKVVADRAPDQGPLMGIASALAESSHEVNLVTTCDAPDVPLWLAFRLLRAARGVEAAVPCAADGRWEPLFAVYGRGTRAAMDAALAAGERRIVNAYAGMSLRRVDIPTAALVTNLNTPEDYARRLKG